jgi:hypothetical protein
MGPFLIQKGALLMTKANVSTLTSLYPAPVILFGIDSRGKPKAARFRKDHASLAVKAAGQLQLQVLANDNTKVAEIAARLPVEQQARCSLRGIECDPVRRSARSTGARWRLLERFPSCVRSD